jgi:hypothetical protein
MTLFRLLDRLSNRGLAKPLTGDPNRALGSCRNPAPIKIFSKIIAGFRRAEPLEISLYEVFGGALGLRILEKFWPDSGCWIVYVIDALSNSAAHLIPARPVARRTKIFEKRVLFYLAGLSKH